LTARGRTRADHHRAADVGVRSAVHQRLHHINGDGSAAIAEEVAVAPLGILIVVGELEAQPVTEECLREIEVVGAKVGPVGTIDQVVIEIEDRRVGERFRFVR
jgi:hypothetical protein